MHTISSRSPVLRAYRWLWYSYSDTVSLCRLFWGIVCAPVALVLMVISSLSDWGEAYIADPVSRLSQNKTVKLVLRRAALLLPFVCYTLVETVVFNILGISWEGSLLRGLLIAAPMFGIYQVFRRIPRPRVLSAIAGTGNRLLFGIVNTAFTVGDIWLSVEPPAISAPKWFRGTFQFIWGFVLDIKNQVCVIYTVAYD